MWDLFNIAIDSDVALEDRYAALRIMSEMQRVNPRNYEKMKKKRDYKKEYMRRKEI